MKLIKFDSTTLPQATRLGETSIRFTRKGSNRLSKCAVEQMGLKAGDKIAIVQDEERPTDFYIIKDKKGYELREQKNEVGLVFSHAALAQSTLDALGHDGDAVSFKIVTEPIEEDGLKMWPILTASAN